MPGPLGGHSWQAMSFSPLTGLVYIPVMEMPNIFVITPNVEKDMPQKPGEPDWKYEDEVIAKVESYYSANLTAWDPEDQRVVWRNELKGLWHGGTLVTAGNLVFQGTSTGEFSAYQADTGKKVWSASIQTAIIAPPVSYQVGNDQYIAVVVGWGGSLGLLKGPIGMDNHVPTNLPRVISFKLNGTYTLPSVPSPPTPTLNPPADTASPEQIASGRAQYGRCLGCHGYWGRSAGDAPDLRYSAMVYDRELLGKIVSGGQLRSAGMPMFGPDLSSQQLDDIRAYLIHQANGQVAREKAAEATGWWIASDTVERNLGLQISKYYLPIQSEVASKCLFQGTDMKVGEVIAEILKREGVEIIFGYPVNHVLETAARAGHSSHHRAAGARGNSYGRRVLAYVERAQNRRVRDAARTRLGEFIWRSGAGLR